MLSELYIKNLAIIEEAVIPFTDDLNVFTGETGAGKSILINGINAVLGQRITREIVRTGCEKAVISALFTKLSPAVIEKLDELGIDHEEAQITVSREISADGGSTARINGRAASVAVLREIGSLIVNIHGQHDNQILLDPEKHISVLDSFGSLEKSVSDYELSFRELQEISRRLRRMVIDHKANAEMEERLKDTVREIYSLELTEDEDKELEAEYRIAQNSEEIINSLRAACMYLDGDDDTPGAAGLISSAVREVSPVSERLNKFESVYSRLEALRIEAEDISFELSSEADRIDTDPARLAFISDRLDKINALKKKYGPELSDVLKTGAEAQEKLSSLGDMTYEIEELTAERDKMLHIVSEKAKALSSERTEAAGRFSEQVEKELAFLNMPDVRIQAEIRQGKLTESGLDSVEFLISANKGEDLKPMSKIASGGELSRIMLALKSVISDKDNIHTLIFDEIDTGVSGKAAQKIAAKLKQLSSGQQIICVTHLSQIAAAADTHLLIEKSSDGTRTYTSVHSLDMEERKKEIARIMVGENITETALQNAEELINASGMKDQ
ncbi:MAG: DNA repair protein RecN [Oscillospiraceae bacterium]|nr:DNA repair protein RecN [Oscillospiraceae bacterium]